MLGVTLSRKVLGSLNVRIASGFVYLAVILDAWSRWVIGYALSRQIDTRLTLAALRAAIETRQPPPGCIHHSDRGAQCTAEPYRKELAKHRLVGSMNRRGNSYDNGKAEKFQRFEELHAQTLVHPP